MRSSSFASIAAVSLSLLSISAASFGEVRRVFVTSVGGTGDLSTWDATDEDGLAGGDEICQARATAGGLAHPALYRAWLSTVATDAYCHLFDLTGQAPSCGGANPNAHAMGPWQRTDGSYFSGDLAEMTGPETKVLRPMRFNEFGNQVNDGTVFWTGTDWDGKVTDDRCTGWDSTSGTGTVGRESEGGRSWTHSVSQSCSENGRLICFEAAAGEEPPLQWRVGALAFLTSTSGTGDLSTWDETNSDDIQGADQICQARAAAAHLPGASTFFALVSNGSVDAVDRVTYPGPYVRVDGIFVGNTKGELFSDPTTALNNPLNVTELEQYLGQITGEAWTGSDFEGVKTADRCSNWSSSASQGEFGSMISLDSFWLSFGAISCDREFHLYCLTNQETLFWDHFERSDTTRWSSTVP